MTLTLIFAILSLIFTNTQNQQTTTEFEIDTRIIGGQAVKRREDVPYQVSVRMGYKHACGGSILTTVHILTAAHCCFFNHEPIDPYQYDIFAGDLDLEPPSANTVSRLVATITIHENYNTRRLDYDVAVMKVVEPFVTEWTPYIRNIELTEVEPESGANCIVTGWGYLKENAHGVSNELQVLKLPIIERERCNYLYNGDITEGMICAGFEEGGKDSCSGDSGGPLVCNNVQFGIVSWGKGCAHVGKPGVYANVARFRQWILTKGIEGNAHSFYKNECNSLLLLSMLISIAYNKLYI